MSQHLKHKYGPKLSKSEVSEVQTQIIVTIRKNMYTIGLIVQ